jgi:hypothetical protein
MMDRSKPILNALSNIITPLLGPLGKDIVIQMPSDHLVSKKLMITNSGSLVLSNLDYDRVVKEFLETSQLVDGNSELVILLDSFTRN